MNNYQTQYHRDGTVTVWDVYRQQWTRRRSRDVARDAEVMASLSDADRLRIEAHAAGRTLSEHRRLAAAIYRAADDEGMVAPSATVRRLVGDPTLHTTQRMTHLAEWAGCRLALDAISGGRDD